MSKPGHFDTNTGTGLAAVPVALFSLRPDDRPGSRPRTGSGVAGTVSLAGQPGHGTAAFMRNQPACIADGRIYGGYNGVYELICPDCGDDPDLDYHEVSAALRQIRGPYPISAGIAAFLEHEEYHERTGKTEPHHARLT